MLAAAGLTGILGISLQPGEPSQAPKLRLIEKCFVYQVPSRLGLTRYAGLIAFIVPWISAIQRLRFRADSNRLLVLGGGLVNLLVGAHLPVFASPKVNSCAGLLVTGFRLAGPGLASPHDSSRKVWSSHFIWVTSGHSKRSEAALTWPRHSTEQLLAPFLVGLLNFRRAAACVCLCLRNNSRTKCAFPCTL